MWRRVNANFSNQNFDEMKISMKLNLNLIVLTLAHWVAKNLTHCFLLWRLPVLPKSTATTAEPSGWSGWPASRCWDSCWGWWWKTRRLAQGHCCCLKFGRCRYFELRIALGNFCYCPSYTLYLLSIISSLKFIINNECLLNYSTKLYK